MKLLTLKLENFQGVKSAEFDLAGESASIYGTNGIGKTTLFSAFTWLLFDKDSTGAKNFSPKTTTPEGGYVHFLDHAAEARLQADSGQIVTLRKVFREVYTKKRGSNTEEFTGHTTDYFLDGVPASEKAYIATLESLCGGAERMKLLTMPDHFAETMPEVERRKLLLEMCGDVSDWEVIAGAPALVDLPDYLLMPATRDQYYEIDKYVEIAAAKKAAVNKELQGIPGRIDEATKAMPDTSGVNKEQVRQKLVALSKQRDALNVEYAAVIAGDTAAVDARKQKAELATQLAEAKQAHMANVNAINAGTYTAIDAAKKEQREVTSRQADSYAEREILIKRIERVTAERTRLHDEYSQTQAQAFDEGLGTCPTCGQALPEDDVAVLRASFNKRKSERLEAIQKQGKAEASKEIVAGLEAKLTGIDAQIKADATLLTEVDARLAALQGQLKEQVPFETTEEYQRILDQLNATDGTEVAARVEAAQKVEGLAGQISGITDEMREQEAVLAKFDQATTQAARIEELKAREKELARQYEDVEKGLYLCDLFTRTKVAMLTEPINAKFQNIKFRLFVEQVNGGIKKACDVLVPDKQTGNLVPFPIANRAGRINAGLEIIDTIGKHWGQKMPVFVDNAESIVIGLYPIETQVVRLVASEQDKVLRLEKGA